MRKSEQRKLFHGWRLEDRSLSPDFTFIQRSCFPLSLFRLKPSAGIWSPQGRGSILSIGIVYKLNNCSAAIKKMRQMRELGEDTQQSSGNPTRPAGFYERIIDSMQHSCFWNVSSCLAGHWIPRVLTNPEAYYRVYKRSQSGSILSQTNQIHILTHNIFKTLVFKTSLIFITY
jgi:hypothetical protein